MPGPGPREFSYSWADAAVTVCLIWLIVLAILGIGLIASSATHYQVLGPVT